MWGSHHNNPLYTVSLGTSPLGQRHKSVKQHPKILAGEERNGGLLGWSTTGRFLFPQAG